MSEQIYKLDKEPMPNKIAALQKAIHAIFETAASEVFEWEVKEEPIYFKLDNGTAKEVSTTVTLKFKVGWKDKDQ